MQSVNFEFLRAQWPELADLGGFAESYALTDPASSCIKSRLLAEHLAKLLCHELHLPITDDNFLSMLKELEHTGSIPKAILDKFHQVRIAGNSAAHSLKNGSANTLAMVEATFDLARWWWVGTVDDTSALPDVFRKPSMASQPPQADDGKAQLEALEAKARALAEENAKLRQKEATLSAELRKQEQAKAQAAFRTSANRATDALKFDEAETRKRLIDTMLLAAGWDVDNPDQVQFEVELSGQATTTGIGFADYVLYDEDGTALAVVEAKRTAKDPAIGRKQAQGYADELERRNPGHFRPLIILCNGYETIYVDDKGGPSDLPVRGYADRHIYGMPSRESLSYRVKYQRQQMKDPAGIAHRPDIADRPYQVEAIKAVAECFGEHRRRKALIVQATGTGKTRVAIAIADVLIRAGFVKRILFLCDRTELRKQARNSFVRFLPDHNVSLLSATKDTAAQIVLATYQGMMQRFQDYDVAWFDLVIADESHRSIYNKYRDLFLYFDALQLGLTATPRHRVTHNTYAMFDCRDGDPTYYYEFERAVREKHLVDFTAVSVTTRFLREGIHTDKLSEDERQQLEEQGIDVENFDVDASRLDKQAYNKDTNRKILQYLMENGLRDNTENGPGKSIVFARNHNHAALLGDLFQEMYPEYGPDYCAVIDNYNPRADQLIDDFKTPGHNPVIAVSVDMLDTGIDVPEVLNLVFAKPVKSYVKFWQMIGRGTRLCPGLLPDGEDKQRFYVFDHWGNCEFFEDGRSEEEPAVAPSLMEKLFERRLALAETSLQRREGACFEQTVPLIRGMIVALPDDSLPVRGKYQHKLFALADNNLEQFEPSTVAQLRQHLLPLMRFVNIRGERNAYSFDLLMTDLQLNLLCGNTAEVENLRARLENTLAGLRANIDAVRNKFPHLKEIESKAFWEKPLAELLSALETKRSELRGIMQYTLIAPPPPPPPPAYVFDLPDGAIRTTLRQRPMPYGDEMAQYRKRVREALEPHFTTDPVLIKIRRGEGLAAGDFEHLTKLALLHQPTSVDLTELQEFYPVTQQLNEELLAIVGMDAETVKAHFAVFYQKYPGLTAQQVAFLNMLQSHIQLYGPIRMERLYEAPFSSISTTGPEGVFTSDRQIDDLGHILVSFTQPQSSLHSNGSI